MTRNNLSLHLSGGAAVLLLCAALFFGLQYPQTKDEAYAALQQEAVYVREGLMLGGRTIWKRLGESTASPGSADGEVLYDSEALPDRESAGLRGGAEALETGEGQASANPESSGESTMYYAQR